MARGGTAVMAGGGKNVIASWNSHYAAG